MQLITNPKKEANEVIFSRQSNTCIFPPVTFNKNIVTTCLHQNHLVLFLIQNQTLAFTLNKKQESAIR